MRNERLRFLPALLLATLAAGACDDGAPTGPGPTPAGISFTLEGSATRAYQSRGSATADSRGIPALGSWAVARPDSVGGLLIAGFQPSGGSSGDLFILQLHPRATGTFSPCTALGEAGCHGRLFLGVDPRAMTVSGGTHTVTAGTVTLTEVSEARVVGTMSLTLQNARTRETLTLRDGTFDVAYSSERTIANGVACLARNLAAGVNRAC